VTVDAVRQYIALLWARYQTLKLRVDKAQLLDELCRNLDIHRKSAIRLMNSEDAPKLRRGRSKAAAPHYSPEARRHLEMLWRRIGYPNSRRLKAALKDWLPDYGDAADDVKQELLSMHPRTMDRYLEQPRAELRRRLNTGTRRGKLLVTTVPIRNLGVKPSEPGHCEVDTVAHCGGSLSGRFHWTVNLTDIVTGWTESEAIPSKEAEHVRSALRKIEARLPFGLSALYFDNGCEFINESILEGFAKEGREIPLPVYRSRPYRKNDQAYIEQKNFTHVRQIMGYDRLTGKVVLNQMNTLYRGTWRDLQNFFQPQSKLISKVRIGSRLIRKMDEPKTPYDRLLAWPGLSEARRAMLQTRRNELDPFTLRSQLTGALRRLRARLKDEWTTPYHGKFHDKVS
jgi:hypothetical protein